MSFLPYGGGSASGWLAATGVSALAHGAVVAMAVTGLAHYDFAPLPEHERPAFRITIDPLDTGAVIAPTPDTLPGVADPVEQTPPAEPERIAALPPEVAPEAPAEPEVAAPPDPVVAEPAEPVAPAEALAPAVPEAAVTPEAPAALPALEAVPTQDAVPTLAPVAEPAAPVAPAAAPASPILSESPLLSATGEGGAAPVAPLAAAPVESVAPVAMPPAAPLVGLAPAAPEVASAQPSQAPLAAVSALPETERLAALPPVTAPPVAAPAPPPPAPPTAQDRALADLIDRVRRLPRAPCLLALPRRDGDEAVGLALIAASEGAMQETAARLLVDEAAGWRQTRTLVDPRQCAALDYLAGHPDYPASALGLALEATVVASGGSLRAEVRGAAGRYLTLLLVDNNGVVQDLQRFAAFSQAGARLDVPVTLDGPARDTAQLLVAIVTDRPPAALADRDGRLAEDVLTGLTGAEATPGAVGVATFDVR